MLEFKSIETEMPTITMERLKWIIFNEYKRFQTVENTESVSFEATKASVDQHRLAQPATK